MDKSRIIYEDSQVLVCHKPSGLATQTSRVGQKDMVSEIKNYLGKNPYLGVVHRLDQPVEGILIFAKTPDAAGKLSRQTADGTMNKQYYALVCGKPGQEQGVLVDYLVKETGGNISSVTDGTAEGAKRAELSYRLLRHDSGRNLSLLEITLATGRHHQIRVQMAHAGTPVLGDLKYGTEESKQLAASNGIGRICLCAFRSRFTHPASNQTMEFEIRPDNAAFQGFLPEGRRK